MRMPLYARDSILRALVPRLVGLAADRRELVPQEHRGDLPVTLLTGRHGMGRTAVLDSLEEAYRGRVPLGRVDVAQIEQGRWSPSTAANTSAVVEILDQLVCQLAPTVPGAGRLRFSRLLPGLFAVSSWHRGSEVEQSLARDRFARLLVACGLEKGTADADGSQWTYDVSERLADPDRRPHDLAPVTEAVVQQYFSRHARSRAERFVHQWYQRRFPGSEDGEAALIRLSLRFHQGGDFQHAVEHTLIAAFLEDLSDAHGRWQRINRTPRPLVLLDNAHTAAGQRVLGLLLEHRAAPESESGTRDPLVVVATRLGDSPDLYPDATRRELPELVHASGWERTVPGSPSAGLLVIPLAPLTRDDLLLMLDPAEGPLHRHLPSALHALTQGHPQGSSMLCGAVVRASGQRAVTPEELLDLPAEEGRPVAEVLLEQLIPQPQLRAHLIPLALARDREAAQALVPASEPAHGGFPGVGLSSAAQYLEEEHWTAQADGAAPATGFVSDPFLRALLLHEARTASAAAPSGRRWEDLHALLCEHHAARGAGHEPDVLRHTLAAGGTDPVVSALTGYFGTWEAGRWLDTLRYAAEAPRPPSDGWTDDRAEIARGAHDHRYAETDDVHRSVNRLLHTLWYLSETYAAPLPDLCDDLGSELAFLSMRHPSGHAVLNEAARSWPAAARERRPYPKYGSARYGSARGDEE